HDKAGYDLLNYVYELLSGSVDTLASGVRLAINALVLEFGALRAGIENVIKAIISGISGLFKDKASSSTGSSFASSTNSDSPAGSGPASVFSVPALFSSLKENLAKAMARLFGLGNGLVTYAEKVLDGISKSAVKLSNSLAQKALQANIGKSIFSLAPPVVKLLNGLTDLLNILRGGTNGYRQENRGWSEQADRNEGKAGGARKSVQNQAPAGNQGSSDAGDVERKEYPSVKAGRLVNRIYLKLSNLAKFGVHLVRAPPAQIKNAIIIVISLVSAALVFQNAVNFGQITLTLPQAVAILPVIAIAAIFIQKGGASCALSNSMVSGWTTLSTTQRTIQPSLQHAKQETTGSRSLWLMIQGRSTSVTGALADGSQSSARQQKESDITSNKPVDTSRSTRSTRHTLTKSGSAAAAKKIIISVVTTLFILFAVAQPALAASPDAAVAPVRAVNASGALLIIGIIIATALFSAKMAGAVSEQKSDTSRNVLISVLGAFVFGLFMMPVGVSASLAEVASFALIATVFLASVGALSAVCVYYAKYRNAPSHDQKILRLLRLKPLFLNPVACVFYALMAVLYLTNLNIPGGHLQDFVGPVALNAVIISTAALIIDDKLSFTKRENLEKYLVASIASIASVFAFCFGFELAQGFGWDTANNSFGTFDWWDLVAYCAGSALSFIFVMKGMREHKIILNRYKKGTLRYEDFSLSGRIENIKRWLRKNSQSDKAGQKNKIHPAGSGDVNAGYHHITPAGQFIAALRHPSMARNFFKVGSLSYSVALQFIKESGKNRAPPFIKALFTPLADSRNGRIISPEYVSAVVSSEDADFLNSQIDIHEAEPTERKALKAQVSAFKREKVDALVKAFLLAKDEAAVLATIKELRKSLKLVKDKDNWQTLEDYYEHCLIVKLLSLKLSEGSSVLEETARHAKFILSKLNNETKTKDSVV
ncbi:MAG: hypothetical protein PHI07_06685, partial [Candidatus Omnitrophica bacterium]|nr:hypothetical protein [Candidatus Omnitrophota bacterium]